MPRRKTPLVSGHYYHVYKRGNNRAPIFFELESYHFFLRQLEYYLVPTHAEIVAYVLMPNHYHLLVKVLSDQFSQAIQRFSISYTLAINKRFDRVGALFQGAFKSIDIEQRDYLLHLSRYIHLNPFRAGLVSQPDHWAYSSYSHYVGTHPNSLIQAHSVLDLLEPYSVVGSRNTALVYRQYVEDGMKGEEGITVPNSLESSEL